MDTIAALASGFNPLSLLAGIIPLLTEAGKAAISRWIAPDTFKPATVEQYVTMKQADIDLFKAINAAGGANPSYLWVEAIVRLQRPIVAIVVIFTWAFAHNHIFGIQSGVMDTTSVDNFAAAIGFYLFADRTLFYARKGQG